MLMSQHYMKLSENQLRNAIHNDAKIPDHAQFIHTQFRSMVLSPQYPCSGAKTAISQGTYRFGVFGSIGERSEAPFLLEALSQFVQERVEIGGEFTTFIAAFTGNPPQNQSHFTELLWNQLQYIHDIDPLEWDPSVSQDPDSPYFSFSIAKNAFFVIGMFGGSSRWSRKFAWPILVFNSHDQFEKLREKGEFDRFKQVVRNRDIKLQGCINPSLEDFGKALESRQYSGELLPSDWKCPFKHKSKTYMEI